MVACYSAEFAVDGHVAGIDFGCTYLTALAEEKVGANVIALTGYLAKVLCLVAFGIELLSFGRDFIAVKHRYASVRSHPR